MNLRIPRPFRPAIPFPDAVPRPVGSRNTQNRKTRLTRECVAKARAGRGAGSIPATRPAQSCRVRVQNSGTNACAGVGADAPATIPPASAASPRPSPPGIGHRAGSLQEPSPHYDRIKEQSSKWKMEVDCRKAVLITCCVLRNVRTAFFATRNTEHATRFRFAACAPNSALLFWSRHETNLIVLFGLPVFRVAG